MYSKYEILAGNVATILVEVPLGVLTSPYLKNVAMVKRARNLLTNVECALVNI